MIPIIVSVYFVHTFISFKKYQQKKTLSLFYNIFGWDCMQRFIINYKHYEKRKAVSCIKKISMLLHTYSTKLAK